jgi:hypothetical protein
MMRHVCTATYLCIPAARMAAMRGVQRTGAQRLRKRVVRAAIMRVPVELAADCVPEASGGVVRVVLVTAGVHARARDGRQARARGLGLEPRIVLRATLAVRAANRECCTEFPRCWARRSGVRVERRAGWVAAAAPSGGLSVGSVALGPAVAFTLLPTCATASRWYGQGCVHVCAWWFLPMHATAVRAYGAPAHS